MKVLQVNCVYKKGSTGKIVYDIHKVLKEKNIESIICYGRGAYESEDGVYKTSSEILAKLNNIKSRFTGMQYNGCYSATKNLIQIIKKENPDVVHLHCINGFFVNIYKIVNFLKVNNIKTILTLHSEFIHTGNCGYAFDCERWKIGCGNCPSIRMATNSYILDRTKKSWMKMKESFENFDNLIIVSVSPWLESRAKESPILSNNEHCTILNGIDTKNIFYPRDFDHLKQKHNISDEKIILHVTASFTRDIKGGRYIIELAENLRNENIKIIVIGNEDSNIKLPENIIDIGKTENQIELAEYYSMADLTVITSKRETFSMVCAESLACGTPVVGFKAGAPEQISLNEYSEFVENGNSCELLSCVKEWINKKNKKSERLASISHEYYSKERMCREYLECYKELMKK